MLSSHHNRENRKKTQLKRRRFLSNILCPLLFYPFLKKNFSIPGYHTNQTLKTRYLSSITLLHAAPAGAAVVVSCTPRPQARQSSSVAPPPPLLKNVSR